MAIVPVRRRLLLASFLPALTQGAVLSLPRAARAQAGAEAWPNRPVHIVVPVDAGGAVDALTRATAAVLQQSLRQPFVVENRPGAGGSIAAAQVARSPSDGNTLLVATIGTHAINAALYPRLPYDPIKDFVPVTLLSAAPNVLVVNPARARMEGIAGVADLVRVAKAKPGRLNMASTGNGSSTHLSGELFKLMTGTYMVHVPYRGSAAALVDLMAGRADVMFDNIASALPSIRDGRLLALAVTGRKRSAALPQVPTVAEAGGPALKDYQVMSWCGLVAPDGTPDDVVALLQKETAKALASPAVAERLATHDAEPGGLSPAAFGEMIGLETQKWARVVRWSGARPG